MAANAKKPRFSERVTIVGAGLCGCLLGILLGHHASRVTILERRADPRKNPAIGDKGRSINLALSARGIRALKAAEVFSQIEPLLMPMRGRLIHNENGQRELLPYGQRSDEQIFSVSRASLNQVLMDAAESHPHLKILFQHEAMEYDRAKPALHVMDRDQKKSYTSEELPVIASDGAGSTIRRSLQRSSTIAAFESLLPHGYKELSMPPSPSDAAPMDPQALHIWPRGQFMLIALPNPGGDFTLTLFMPNEGPDSFAALDTEEAADNFFHKHFPDVVPFLPDLGRSFLSNPVGLLGSVHCRQWHDGGDVLLIGDAAHAIVPFHGQGMNLAFEDCLLLDEILRGGTAGWQDIFSKFQLRQLENANAMADMALENYVEMRDTVRDEKFKLRKALSFELERRLPDRFIPRYSMVMFHDDIPYAVAKRRGALQESLLLELTHDATRIEEIDLDSAVVLVREQLPALPDGDDKKNQALS